MFPHSQLLAAALLLWSVIAYPLACSAAVPKLVYKFPNTTYGGGIENIGVTSSGHLLLNANKAPRTYIIDPHVACPTASLVATFPDASSCLGIAEVASNTFAIVAGNYTSTFEGVAGSFAIWLLDITNSKHPETKLLTKIPEAQALNGVTKLSGSSDLILVADSGLGAVWSVDIKTGHYEQAISSQLFTSTAEIPLGINGLHTVNNNLYFTNTAQGFFGKVNITKEGKASGPVSKIAENIAGDDYDDFAFDKYGNAFIANHPNAISGITRSGQQYTVANVTGPTSAVFAKDTRANGVLYVPTIEGHVYAIDIY
ncbi:MAG: hypothetical protein GOMPHAMPRED_004395 [Gomphillus americanus]|uniref:SMP-30/Gluconolactonase/LRE-like region domain-containing protein n=1 Tax=Gomphillus americanus TaxID=1940652 RepID=A0A8H3IUR5_9LECA|nr:MAG: hypothetical protein GOMPHAMPRED_004395 [Gomphillus americanus]